MQSTESINVSSTDLQRLEAILKDRKDADSPTITALKKELRRATILPQKDMPPTVVTMNSKVKFVIEPTGKQFDLTLVYPSDAEDHRSDIISITSPIGSALLGLSIRQTISWPLPGGHNTTVRVVEISYQPEREGRFIFSKSGRRSRFFVPVSIRAGVSAQSSLRQPHCCGTVHSRFQ